MWDFHPKNYLFFFFFHCDCYSLARIFSASKIKCSQASKKWDSSVNWDPTLVLPRVWGAVIAWFVHELLRIAESHILFKKNVSEQWRWKFLLVDLTTMTQEKMESTPEGWRMPLFKSLLEVKGWVRGRRWPGGSRQLAYGREQIPNPATVVRKFSWGPRGNKTRVQIQECSEPSSNTGQRKNLFKHHLELQLLSGLFFLLCFQSYLIFVCFLLKPSLKTGKSLVCSLLKKMVHSSKLWPTQGFVRQATKIKNQNNV